MVVESTKGYAFTPMGKKIRLPGMDGFYSRHTASPDEIVEAKLDGCCPRCEHKQEFGDEGLCEQCGFSY